MTDDPIAPTIPETAHPSSPRIDRGVPPAPDDRYVMRSLLGKGGMGEVWLARDLRIDRDIAIKMMRGERNPEAVARFLREARVQGRLEHPAIVPVHDLGGDDSAPFFAMKRLTGTTLAEVLASPGEKWTRRALLARLVDVCLAIELAHQRGVLHRDLKPANIMLGDFGETYVLDWGLARIAEVAELGMIRTSDLRSGESGGGQTMAGTMLGTPGYMAPEQMRGETIDQRVDVFALGCILFEILVGTPAVPRDQAFEVTLAATHHRPSERKPDAEVPPELDELCAAATTADLARRLPTARALGDAIQKFLDGDRDLARRRELAAEHAARAAEAFAKGGDAARADAMREGGRAIALDPENRAAQDVLARMLLEPPQTVPQQAVQRIEDDKRAMAQTVVRNSGLAFFGFLLLLPLIRLLGVRNIAPLAAIAVLLTALGTLCLVHSRRPRRIPGPLFTLVLVLHAALLAFVGVLFGPLLVSPILIVGSLAAFVTVPSVDMPKRAVAALCAALLVPLVLEWTGVLPRTYHVTATQLVFTPWAIDFTPTAYIFGIIATFVLQVIVTAVICTHLRRSQERAHEQLHIQSWHLRHLLPDA